MKCPMCGRNFSREEAKTTCEGCPIGGACAMVRCPNCNYEVPLEPNLIKMLRTWKEKLRGVGRKSRRGARNTLDID